MSMPSKLVSLFAVQRHKPGGIAAFQLTALAESHRFEQWWAGQLDDYNSVRLMASFKELHQKQLWLACSCLGHLTNPPLIGLVEKDGAFSLRRLMERPNHHPDCVFWSEQNLETKKKTDAPSGDDQEQRQPDFLTEGKELVVQHRASPIAQQQRGQQGEVVDSYAARLFWLLKTAKVNCYPKFQNSNLMVLDAARAIALKDALMLSDVLFCNSKAWLEGWMQGAFKKSLAASFGQQAVLICPVLRASRSGGWVQLAGGADTTAVQGRLAIYGDDASPSRYPMLMYATVKVSRSGTPALMRAYLHPVYKENDWTLVDSHNERTALDVLLQACGSLSKTGIHIAIEKPLTNWRNTGVRPDFVLTRLSDQKVLIIETMGFDDDQYLERKRKLVAALDGFSVFEDFRLARSARGDDRLSQCVSEFMSSPTAKPGV